MGILEKKNKENPDIKSFITGHKRTELLQVEVHDIINYFKEMKKQNINQKLNIKVEVLAHLKYLENKMLRFINTFKYYPVLKKPPQVIQPTII